MKILRTFPATLVGAFAVLGGAGCAATPAAERPAPAPAPMAYALPGPASARYIVTDSTTFDAQMVRTEITTRSVVDMRLQPEPDAATRVRATVVDFDGTFANRTTGATTSVDESGAAGEFSFRLDPRGQVTEFTRPSLAPDFQQVGRGGEFMRTPFVRLPGALVTVGATWTDTLTSEEESEGIRTRTRSIVTSTWTRDTLDAGRTLRVIESSTHTTVEVDGEIQGMTMSQRLEGSSTALSFWDPAPRLVVRRRSSGELAGSMTLPQVGSLPVRVRLASSAELVPAS